MPAAMTTRRRESINEQQLFHETFDKYDKDGDGILGRGELQRAVSDIIGDEVDTNHIEIILQEFDKDGNGEIDFSEFRTIAKYLQKEDVRRKSTVRGTLDTIADELRALSYDSDEESDTDHSDEDVNFTNIGKTKGNDRLSQLLNNAIGRSKRDSNSILKKIALKLSPFRNILCVQDPNYNQDMVSMHESRQFDFDPIRVAADMAKQQNLLDPDFKAAFPPSDMRCLALVSHNGMKKTMREFVVANKNILKKFRLTGTNSTMTMLKEIFKDEAAGTVMFGPSCASGPLGGDAELVALMVGGRIGGILFFQDPMNAHPHRADIDCLIRQAMVHNTMIAENPTTAYMLVSVLRCALQEDKAELIPSFFFSLQSPTVASYKAQQKSVVDAQKALVSSMEGM